MALVAPFDADDSSRTWEHFNLLGDAVNEVDGRSVPRFASTAARDTAIPAPIAGMVCAVAGTLQSYTGTAWRDYAPRAPIGIVNLNSIVAPGGTISNFQPTDGVCYVCSGADTFTISGTSPSGSSTWPEGTRVFLSAFTGNVGKITLVNGPGLNVPGGSFEISVAQGRGDAYFQLVKSPGTGSVRLLL